MCNEEFKKQIKIANDIESAISRSSLSKEERKKAAIKAAGSAKNWTVEDYREIKRLADHKDWE